MELRYSMKYIFFDCKEGGKKSHMEELHNKYVINNKILNWEHA